MMPVSSDNPYTQDMLCYKVENVAPHHEGKSFSAVCAERGVPLRNDYRLS